MNLFNLMNRFKTIFAAALLAATLPLSGRAQENLIGTVGLAHTDANGRNWAYITWQAGNAESLGNQSFALYGKVGTATSISNYVRLAILARQQDTHVIDSLLQRSQNLGDNLALLDSDLNQLFGELIPSASLSTADKLSAILRGTEGNDLAYRNLNLLARLHPGVALTLGVAAAERFPTGATNMTFEVRQWDAANSRDLAVIGRVTVVAGQPLVLPAPGLAVELPDTTGSGHLNVKLRWAVPDPLRRLGIATHGFNVWRFTKSRAETLGYTNTPPTTAQLLAAATNFPADVQRVNDLPIVVPKIFTTSNVGDFSTNTGDPKTFFITDNNRVAFGNLAFTNGEKFYYYVTARDLLGRDGVPSGGKLVTACDRIPPQAPRQLRARTVHSFTNSSTPVDGILLTWQRPPDAPTNPPLGYNVYRYRSLIEMRENSDDAFTNRIAGPLRFPTPTNLFYIDQVCTNTLFQTNEGFWYVVRAVETNVCGTNISPHSGAAWGTCRDWQGPGAISGYFTTECPRVNITCDGTEQKSGNTNGGDCSFILQCTRSGEGSALVQSVEFFTSCTNFNNNVLRITNQIAFDPGSTVVSVPVNITRNNVDCGFQCRITLSDGQVFTNSSSCLIGDCSGNVTTVVKFNVNVDFVPVSSNGNQTNELCKTFFTRTPYPNPTPGSAETNSGLKLSLTLPVGTKEYRVYRSIDGGPRGLVSDGTNTTGTINITDDAMPINSATICYYAQALDENGNPGPLQLIEPCIDVSGSIAQPQQSPISGTALSIVGSIMRLQWFCPTPGVDHFEVWISNGDDISADLLRRPTGATSATYTPYTNSSPDSFETYSIWRTPRVGPLFGTNDNYSIFVNTAVGREHSVLIRAIDVHGNVGPLSNLEKFKGGLEKIILQPKVAWPARELPATSTRTFTPALALIDTNTICFDGVGVVVGAVRICNFNCLTPGISTNTMDIATDSDGESIFPCVLYRQQVSNAKFPQVTGDVVQVSPLIESIVTGPAIPPFDCPTLRDPYFIVNYTGDNNTTSQIILKDTQPVMIGARYRYTLVRFKSNHEIKEIISLGEIGVSQ